MTDYMIDRVILYHQQNSTIMLDTHTNPFFVSEIVKQQITEIYTHWTLQGFNVCGIIILCMCDFGRSFTKQQLPAAYLFVLIFHRRCRPKELHERARVKPTNRHTERQNDPRIGDNFD